MPPPLPAPPPVEPAEDAAELRVCAAAGEPAEQVAEPAAATAARCLLEEIVEPAHVAVPSPLVSPSHYENATAVMSISSTSRLRQNSPPVSER